jgi:hypothetical protein
MHPIEAALKKARNTGTPFSFPVDKQLEEQLKNMTLATPEELAAMKRAAHTNSHSTPKKGGSRRKGRKGRKTRSNRG